MKKFICLIIVFMYFSVIGSEEEAGAKCINSDTPKRDEAYTTIDLSELNLVNGVMDVLPTREIGVQMVLESPAAFSASGLPEGLEMTPDGWLHGSITEEGRWEVVVTAYLLSSGETRTARFVIQCWYR